MTTNFQFRVSQRLAGSRARAGVITTPHGQIKTPAFIPVGTRATLKGLTPEQLAATGAQAVLANAYHLYLRPGADLVEELGGLHRFMNWPGPIVTDSGGFQVMSLGVGHKKVIDMRGDQPQAAPARRRLARVDDGGVNFISYLDGSPHRFTPEVSMRIQHQLGADIIFTFDELTTLHHTRAYQEASLERRTHPWALASLAALQRLRAAHPDRPYQALFAVIQGAQHRDLRQRSARFLAAQPFDGFGLGGAFVKDMIGPMVGWMVDELPEDKPRHMLGIADPDDIFACIEHGADTFDCVSPARLARNGAVYTPTGRITITNRQFRRDAGPIDDTCPCYTCQHYSRAYVHHLLRVGELLGATLATIHNEQFIVRLVAAIRQAIVDGALAEYRAAWLARYYRR